MKQQLPIFAKLHSKTIGADPDRTVFAKKPTLLGHATRLRKRPPSTRLSFELDHFAPRLCEFVDRVF